jgi:hypothetical protein
LESSPSAKAIWHPAADIAKIRCPLAMYKSGKEYENLPISWHGRAV